MTDQLPTPILLHSIVELDAVQFNEGPKKPQSYVLFCYSFDNRQDGFIYWHSNN